MKVIQEKRGVH